MSAELGDPAFIGVGAFVAALGAFIRVRRRADLLANYSPRVDPEHAAVRAGNVVALTGLFIVAVGATERYVGLPVGSSIAATLVVVALAFVAAARAQGY